MTDRGPELEFGSMFLRRISGDKLISMQTALEIARLVLRDNGGQSELDENEPLSAAEDGDTWVVQGGASTTPVKGPSGLLLNGRFKMRISQFDGQILDCVFIVTLPLEFPIPPAKP
jgi:hypothetical protein